MSQEKMAAKVERAVLRGVRLLDKRDPLWWNGADAPAVIEGMVGHIDLDVLDLGSQHCCVLGQRHEEGYVRGLRSLSIGDRAEQVRYGFEIPDAIREGSDIPFRAYSSALTEAWASVIQSRRYPRRAIARTPFAIEANRTWKRSLDVKGSE